MGSPSPSMRRSSDRFHALTTEMRPVARFSVTWCRRSCVAFLTLAVTTRRCATVGVEGVVGLFGAEAAVADAAVEVESVAWRLENRRLRAPACVGEGTGVGV